MVSKTISAIPSAWNDLIWSSSFDQLVTAMGGPHFTHASAAQIHNTKALCGEKKIKIATKNIHSFAEILV